MALKTFSRPIKQYLRLLVGQGNCISTSHPRRSDAAVQDSTSRVDGATVAPAAGRRADASFASSVWLHPWWVSVITAVLLFGVVLGSAARAETDVGSDLGGLLLSTGRLFARMSWLAVAAIVALSALHYIAAASAAGDAAAGVRTPFGETVLVQLSASTANRLTSAGLGGSVVQARYMMRRGGLSFGAAVSAVSALTLLGRSPTSPR